MRKPNEQYTAKILAVGRVLLSLLFVVVGYEKLTGFSGTVTMLSGKGFPFPELLAVGAVVLLLGGGLLVLFGMYTRIGALGLIMFLVLATIMFHLDIGDPKQRTSFLSNVSLIGGLLYLFAAGPGAWAVDNKRSSPSPKE